MKTKSPTLIDLPRLAQVGHEERNGAPRVLALLPDDGGRVVVTLFGYGNSRVESVSDAVDDALASVGYGADRPDGERFEPFHVNGIPYRFSVWTDREDDERNRLPSAYVDRLDVFLGGATDSATSKLRNLGRDLLAYVYGMRPTLVDDANRAETARQRDAVDDALAKTAATLREALDRREELTDELRKLGDPDARREDLPRVDFEEGRAILSLHGVDVTLAHRDDVVRVGLDVDEEEPPALGLRFGELEGIDAVGAVWQEVAGSTPTT